MAEPRLFRMPSLGADMTEGSVLEWLVQPGDRVHRGDLVAVIKTDKADVEAEIFDDGVIGELLVPVSDAMLPIGAPLATIYDLDGAPQVPAPTPVVPVPPPVSPVPPVPPGPVVPSLTTIVLPSPQGDRIAASPYARRRATELGVDLARVAPDQPGHPIRAADVEHAAEHAPVVARVPVDQTSAMRRAIGNLMARSKREIPHYYLEEDIALTHAMAWLAQHNERVPVEERILPAALLYKAVAVAARETPAMNGYWSNDEFVPGDGVHLGVAIAMRGGGLVAPAIRDADQCSLPELMVRLRDLTSRVRGGRLRASEMTDATITVTSLGDRGVRAVYGVIYAPQVALVGFGKVSDRVWDADGGVGIRPVVTATLSADHRATDGMLGARFLAGIARQLHHPEEL
jgi:pyruvate dehydrogenase E2 component (dihydrolipoamide acetyltransferase)